MRLPFLTSVLLLGGWSLGPAAHGQSKSPEKTGWQAAVEALEAKGVRLLLPIHQLWLSELSAATRQAEAAGDQKRSAELEAVVAAARQDHDLLENGRVPHPGGAAAERNAFLRHASGMQWALTGTRQVKRVGVRGSGLHLFSETGQHLNELCRMQLLPGVFGNRRNDGSGWSYYLISPAFDQGCCVVSPGVAEGRLTARQQSAPPPSPGVVAVESAPLPKVDSQELRVLLEQKYRQELVAHEKKLVRLLEALLTEATATDRGPLELRLEQARLALAWASVPNDRPPPPPETEEAFHARLAGCEWQLARLPATYRLIVANDKTVQILGSARQVVESMPAETLWPGVLRARKRDGSQMMVVFSPDLERVLTFPVLSYFPARRVE